MNHLFVTLSGGGRSSVSGTDPTSILRVVPSRGGVLALTQVDRRSGFHRKPDAPHPPVRRLRERGARSRLCDPASTVVRPRHGGVDRGRLGLAVPAQQGDGFAEPAACRVRWDDLVHECVASSHTECAGALRRLSSVYQCERGRRAGNFEGTSRQHEGQHSKRRTSRQKQAESAPGHFRTQILVVRLIGADVTDDSANRSPC